MIETSIPGGTTFRFQHLVLDVNGTIAKDGQLIDGVAELLKELQTKLKVHLITADTHGCQAAIDQQLNLAAICIPTQNQVKAKLHYIEELGAEAVVAIGNGVNDSAMLERAALGIAIVGPEGAATTTLLRSDVVVQDIRTALELLLYPKRLIATLRQ